MLLTFGTPQDSGSGSGSAETCCIRHVAFRVIVSFSRCDVLPAASSSWWTWRSWGDGPADGPAGSGHGWEALFPWRRASWEGTCTGIKSWSPFCHSVVEQVCGKFGRTSDSLSSRTSSILTVCSAGPDFPHVGGLPKAYTAWEGWVGRGQAVGQVSSPHQPWIQSPTLQSAC